MGFAVLNPFYELVFGPVRPICARLEMLIGCATIIRISNGDLRERASSSRPSSFAKLYHRAG
jgi:hypothetical protein